MKIIDLFVKIANGEELPKKIKYNGYIFEYNTNHRRYESYFEQIWALHDFININDSLNDEVEIIEEEKKIPEKIGLIKYCEDQATSLIHHKVDEIIDYLDYLESKEKGE